MGTLVKASGVRLFDLSCLREALESLLDCRYCSSGKLDLQEDEGQADKLYSALYVVCGTCSHRLLINTSRPTTEENSSCKWEVNRCTEQVIQNLKLEEELLKNIFQTYSVAYPLSQNFLPTSGSLDVQDEFEQVFQEVAACADEGDHEIEELAVPSVIVSSSRTDDCDADQDDEEENDDNERFEGREHIEEFLKVAKSEDNQEIAEFGVRDISASDDLNDEATGHSVKARVNEVLEDKDHIEEFLNVTKRSEGQEIEELCLRGSGTDDEDHNAEETGHSAEERVKEELEDTDDQIEEFLKVPERNETSIPKDNYKGKTYSCLLCNQAFRRLSALKQHSSEHNEPETFSCVKCMQTFHSDSELKHHLKIHGKKEIECTICGKKFKRTFNLKQHVRTHTGEKPFLCATCGKSFGDQSTMNKHKKTVHRDERHLKCDICSKTFYLTSHLKVHMRRHTGEKPYSCNLCGKTYSYADSVKKHMLTHTDDRNFRCKTCGRCFRWKESLNQHSKTHQPQQGHSGQGQEQVDVASSSEALPAPGTDVVSLTQVNPFLETVKLKYY